MLTKSLEKRFDFEGMSIELDIPFNNILLVYELQGDKMFNDVEKINLSFDLMVNKCSKKLNINTKSAIIQHIFKKYISVVNVKGSKNTAKTYDFNYDSGLIYASFMSDYHIDLYDHIDKLDWRKFIWLFHGLSKDCKIKEVIGIRTMKLPKQTKDNAEYVQNIMEMKHAYQLEMSTEEREKRFAESLKAFAKKYTKER